MVVVTCSVPTCNFKTNDVSEALAIALLANHGLAHQHTHQNVSAPTFRGPKLERPKVNIGVSTEEWNVFTRRWEMFCSGSAIDETSAPAQLCQCAGDELSDSLLKANPQAASNTLSQLFADMRSFAVIPVATGVSRTELFQLRQAHDEPFHAFAAPPRVCGKAETCAFTTKCECAKIVNYSDHMIRDVLLHGISDIDIRREVLGVSDILETAVNEVISLVEGKEMARNALPSANMSRISSFKQQQSQQPDPRALTSSSEETTCPDCKNLYETFTQGPRGWSKKTHKVCLKCYRARRRRDRKQQHTSTPTPAVQSLASDSVLQGGTIEVNEPQLQGKCNCTPCSINTIVKQTTIILGHQVFTKGE